MHPPQQNARTTDWARRYQAALRLHLVPGRAVSPRLVQALGRQAVALGLETLDLARTHERALAALISPSASARSRERTVQRAKAFFAATAVRLEKTHRAARDADALIRLLSRTLRDRTRQSSASNRRLAVIVAQRQSAETALKKSKAHHSKLLTESHRLLTHLRKLAHTCLTDQEADRTSVSHQLHDDIAQGLLGIHVRLLALKTAMKASTASLKKEVGCAQRLVRQSNQKIRRFAHEHPVHHKA